MSLGQNFIKIDFLTLILNEQNNLNRTRIELKRNSNWTRKELYQNWTWTWTEISANSKYYENLLKKIKQELGKLAPVKVDEILR